VHLTGSEYRILLHLARHPGTAFSRAAIMSALWEESPVGDERAIDVHMHNIREKLEPDPKSPTYILTVRGFATGSKSARPCPGSRAYGWQWDSWWRARSLWVPTTTRAPRKIPAHCRHVDLEGQLPCVTRSGMKLRLRAHRTRSRNPRGQCVACHEDKTGSKLVLHRIHLRSELLSRLQCHDCHERSISRPGTTARWSPG